MDVRDLYQLRNKTSRERHKSEIYLGIKNSEGTPKYFLLQYPKNSKVGTNWRVGTSLVRSPGALKGGTLSDFSTSILLQNIKKIEGGTFWMKKFRNKVSKCREKNKDPLVSPGIICYAEKKEKLLYFSSLCQTVQLGTLKLRRTILVSSCGSKKKNH